MLAAEWVYAPSTTNTQLVGLVADAQANLFSVECGYAGMFRAQCAILSLSPTGAVRWRTNFTHITSTGQGALTDSLLIAGDQVIAMVGRSWVDSFDINTGAVRWSLDLATPAIFPGATPSYVRILSAAFNGTDELVFALEEGSTLAGLILGVDSQSGAIRHSFRLPAQGFSLLLDKQANIFIAHSAGAPGTFQEALTALDKSWALRWQRVTSPLSNQIHTLSATNRGSLLMQHPNQTSLVRTGTGATCSTALPASRIAYPNVWSNRALFMVQQHCRMAACSGFLDFDIDLVVVEEQNLLQHRVRLSPLLSWGAPWVTSRDTALFTVSDRTGVTRLWEVDPKGQVLMRCPMDWEARRRIRSGPLLTPERYAVITGLDVDGYDPRIEVWRLPTYTPGSSGWLSPRGGPTLDLRAR